MDGFAIERVDYDEEYGSGEDLAAMLLAEALAGEGDSTRVPGQAGTSGGGCSAPTPGPSREREGSIERYPVPLPLAGGVRGGGGADSPSEHPTRPGPEPLLTRPLQAVFCEHLARHGNVRLACRAARVSAQTAYRMRRASASFRALWYAALVIARDQVEDVLADRAVHGWEEAVFYHGEEVARRRRYDSRLLLAHLARLDKLAERAAGGVVERFDEAIDALAADEEVAVPACVPAEAGTSGGEAPDGGRPLPAQGLGIAGVPAQAGTSCGDSATEGTPLVEAQLLWLEAEHGPLSEAEEAFHLHHTVPGVPGSALRRFGWRGTEAELAALNARWQRLGDRLPGEGDEEEDEWEDLRVPAQAGTSGVVAPRCEEAPACAGAQPTAAISPAAARC